MDTATAETRTTLASVPVNNIIDNFNWNHGKHDFQFGANWRLVDQNRTSDAVSFNAASSNPYWLGGDPPDPSAIIPGAPPVDSGFSNSYVIAYANLIGTVPSVTNQYNYQLTSATSGNLLADPDADPHLRNPAYSAADPLRNQWSGGHTHRRHRCLVQGARECGAAGPDQRASAHLCSGWELLWQVGLLPDVEE
jgi:hypothetical protein